jgi:orotate phosphoribosyltransferase
VNNHLDNASIEKNIEILRNSLLNEKYITRWRPKHDIYLHTWLAIHDFLPVITEILFYYSKKIKIEFDYVGALGRSGLPIASALSLRYSDNKDYKPMIFIGDPVIGKHSQWDPPLKPSISKDDLNTGSRVLLLDTVVRTGYTAEDAVDKLLQNGLAPKHFLVLVDFEKENNSRESIQEILHQGVKMTSVFKFKPKNSGKIDENWLTRSNLV